MDCKGGCGFFGTESNRGYCSQCVKNAPQEPAVQPTPAGTTERAVVPPQAAFAPEAPTYSDELLQNIQTKLEANDKPLLTATCHKLLHIIESALAFGGVHKVINLESAEQKATLGKASGAIDVLGAVGFVAQPDGKVLVLDEDTIPDPKVVLTLKKLLSNMQTKFVDEARSSAVVGVIKAIASIDHDIEVNLLSYTTNIVKLQFPDVVVRDIPIKAKLKIHLPQIFIVSSSPLFADFVAETNVKTEDELAKLTPEALLERAKVLYLAAAADLRDRDGSLGDAPPTPVPDIANPGGAGGAGGAGADAPISGLKRVFSAETRSRLGFELDELKKSDGQEGISVSVVDDNIFVWDVTISGFQADSTLLQDLQKVGRDSVVLRFQFPTDYPTSPPTVLVQRPRFTHMTGNVLYGGVLCASILTLHGWSPAASVLIVANELRDVLTTQHGRVDVDEPYTEAEQQSACTRVQRHRTRTKPETVTEFRRRYVCYPPVYVHREDIEGSGRALLSVSEVEGIVATGDSLLEEILEVTAASGGKTYVGLQMSDNVSHGLAGHMHDDWIVLPFWIMQQLCAAEGDVVIVKAVRLPPAKALSVQAVSPSSSTSEQQLLAFKQALRGVCATQVGDTLTMTNELGKWTFHIVATQPASAVNTHHPDAATITFVAGGGRSSTVTSGLVSPMIDLALDTVADGLADDPDLGGGNADDVASLSAITKQAREKGMTPASAVIETPTAVGTGPAAALGADADVLAAAPKQTNRGRCFQCKKKVPLGAQIACKCKFVFCPFHRAPETHECTFDFKGTAQAALQARLEKEKAVPSKLTRIPSFN